MMFAYTCGRKEPLAGFRCQTLKCKPVLPESGKCSECGKEHVMDDLKRQFALVPALFEKSTPSFCDRLPYSNYLFP